MSPTFSNDRSSILDHYTESCYHTSFMMLLLPLRIHCEPEDWPFLLAFLSGLHVYKTLPGP